MASVAGRKTDSEDSFERTLAPAAVPNAAPVAWLRNLRLFMEFEFTFRVQDRDNRCIAWNGCCWDYRF